nr:hypothetical protein BaRGS_034993 [Batillaria attramentaria]
MGSSALEASISQLADRLGKLEDDRKVLTGQLEELKMEHSQLRDKLSRPPDTQPRVAFHAWLGTSPIYVTPFSRLILREITTNVGSAYNATTGKFVAPVPGVYLFIVTTAANPLNTIFAGLQVMYRLTEHRNRLLNIGVKKRATELQQSKLFMSVPLSVRTGKKKPSVIIRL